MSLKESLDKPVSLYTSTGFAQAAPEDSVAAAAKTMEQKGTTEAVVVKGGEPVGIVTERDILYKIVAKGADPSQARVSSIMSAPVRTIDEAAKVADAISAMSSAGCRRLGVTRNGRLVGLVTQKEMVAGSLREGVPLPELSSPKGLSCPYCGASMKHRDELSKHIDQVHLGMGLLEGDRTKW